MLTIYYVSSTLLQSWRVQKVCNKIAEQLAQQTSVAFYALQAGNEDGFDTGLATSELCINRSAAKVTEILWMRRNQRGCCLRPVQMLHIAPWISFQTDSSWLPFAYTSSMQTVGALNAPAPPVLHADKAKHLSLLLEAHIEPFRQRDKEEAEVRLEEYGKLIAWKIDSHLAVLIETDVEHFTKLLIATFLRDNPYINDQLPLLRIESVLYDGKPQPFQLLANHLRRSTRTTAELSVEAWQKHLADLRALGVLAHQATAFEYNKSRTEGKTGVTKPDLIPQEQQAAAIASAASKEATNDATTHSPTKLIQIEASTSKARSTNVANRLKAQPTEVRKPGAMITESRFKSTKVCESPPSKTSGSAPAVEDSSKANVAKSKPNIPAMKAASKESELEKIAAATASRKQKSPIRVSNSSQTSTPTSSSISKATTATPTKSKIVSPSKTITASTPTKAAVTVESPLLKKDTPVKPSKTATVSSTEQQAASSNTSLPNSQNNAPRPGLTRNKGSLCESKPLNVMVYSDSASARDSTVATLREILEPDTYTIYAMTSQQAEQKHWLEQTALLVVCGTVAEPIGEILVDYFLHGGKVLSLCSDILHFVLPNYRTAEVREHELVQFSYDKWRKVKMMHHIFCYQPSPVKKHFSTDSEESGHSRKPALVCPRSIELKDLAGQAYKLEVQVLGTEETWNTPSLVLANSLQSGGRAVFSQVHLEISPSEFENDETSFEILKQSEKTRLEIFSDLLCKYLEVQVQQATAGGKPGGVLYQQAYFLGRHESKFELIAKLKPRCGVDNAISTRKLTLKFCGKGDKPPNAGNNVLPILIHSCPDDFSTVDYFEHLKTTDIGRLVIYAPVVSSSMHVINDLELTHGIAVLPRQQTDGVGRTNNQWLSPLGCAMFSLQLHINMDSPLGTRIPLIQHIIGAAMVNTLRGHELYRDLDIAIKWPNDIYVNGINKIGGIVVNTTLMGSQAIVNIGCGLNLDNTKPTVCINDLIVELNRCKKRQLPLLKYEQLIALIFNEIENLMTLVQSGDFDGFYKIYYGLWLHNAQSVKICSKNNEQVQAKIVGIDDYGFLRVQLANGDIESVQPDGNSFDMLKGLIVPKYN